MEFLIHNTIPNIHITVNKRGGKVQLICDNCKARKVFVYAEQFSDEGFVDTHRFCLPHQTSKVEIYGEQI